MNTEESPAAQDYEESIMDMAFILGTAAPCHTLAKGSRAKDWERGAQTVRRCGVTAQGVLRREPSRDREKAPKFLVTYGDLGPHNSIHKSMWGLQSDLDLGFVSTGRGN